MSEGPRRTRRAGWSRAVGALVLFGLLAAPGRASAGTEEVLSPLGTQAEPLEARVWLGRGEAAVVERGDRARLYYRTSEDAYVAIFHINTDGITRLLHPRVPDEDHYVRGGRDYRLLFPTSPYWYVDDDPGVGYFFVVASPRPLDFSAIRYSHEAGGWDLTAVGRRVYQDPYAAMDDYVAELIPGWRDAVYALDFAEYHVGRRHEYPRFLCYDCHGFRPYQSWNPYHYACRSFRLVIYTDPYFYPASRYRGSRVVYTRPPAPTRARFAFKERAEAEPWTPLYRRRGEGDLPGVEGAERRRSPAGAGVGVDAAAAERTDGRAAPRRRDPDGALSGGPSGVPGEQGRARQADGVPGIEDGSPLRRGREDAGDPPRPVLRRRPADDEGPTSLPSPVEGNPSTPVQVRPPSSENPRARPPGGDPPRGRPSDVLDRAGRSRGGPPEADGGGAVRRAPSEPAARAREPEGRPPSPRERGSGQPPRSAPSTRPRDSSGSPSPSPSVRPPDRDRDPPPSARPSIRPRGSSPPPPSVRRRPPPSGSTPSARGSGRSPGRTSSPAAGSRGSNPGGERAAPRPRRRPPPGG